ncbi:MAG: hypothetical protein KA715_11005 [Xanthomonadaceae bacterium]|nr:hypothetical protein [Xanthomonadaceae bacterium]
MGWIIKVMKVFFVLLLLATNQAIAQETSDANKVGEWNNPLTIVSKPCPKCRPNEAFEKKAAVTTTIPTEEANAQKGL